MRSRPHADTLTRGCIRPRPYTHVHTTHIRTHTRSRTHAHTHKRVHTRAHHQADVKSRLARAAAEGAGGKVFDVHDPESLDELMEECVSGRSSWAHLGHIGPAINNSFRSVLECFPCSDPKCMKAKLKGGGKMFCLLRFILDPGHVMPAIRRKSVLRCFKYGKEIQRFAGLYVKTFEQKRTAHNWGTLRVDEMGVLRALERVANKVQARDRVCVCVCACVFVYVRVCVCVFDHV